MLAGYFGGWVDTLISRMMDVFLAFPLLLFAIASSGVVPDQAFGLHGQRPAHRACSSSSSASSAGPTSARIVRGQTLSLREREFVDAAR